MYFSARWISRDKLGLMGASLLELGVLREHRLGAALGEDCQKKRFTHGTRTQNRGVGSAASLPLLRLLVWWDQARTCAFSVCVCREPCRSPHPHRGSASTSRTLWGIPAACRECSANSGPPSSDAVHIQDVLHVGVRDPAMLDLLLRC